MIRLSQARTKRLLAIHGWSGVILGLLLYVVVLTGAVVVFAHDIGAWSAGGAKSHAPLSEPLDGTLRSLASQVPHAYLDDVGVFANAAGHLVVFLHTHAVNDAGDPDDKGVLFELHPKTHAVLQRREGFGSEIFGQDPWGALDEFLVDLHVNLYLPQPWGLYATGVLGLLLMSSAISGILLHRHLIKDLFVAPRPSGALLNARDRHNLAGSWALPFALVLAFTGAFLSFAISLGFPAIGQVAFGGDQMALIEKVVGVPEAEDPTPTPLADLDAMLAASAAAVGSAPDSLTVQRWGRADARVLVNHPPAAGDLSAEQQVFAGASGEHLGSKPFIGTQPSAGSAIMLLMFPLHFGSFAGLLSRAVWLALGLALCYVVLTGLLLWLRRRAEDPLWQRLARAVPVVGYGLPIGLVGSGVAFFLTVPAEGTLFWTPVGFVIGACLAVAAGLSVRQYQPLAKLYRSVLGVGLFALPLLRLVMVGPGWGELLATGNGAVVAFDLVLLASGLGIVRAGIKARHLPAATPPPQEQVAPE